ncbi:unnamed protein product, partial [Aphanomyces euteiches]
TKQDEKKLSQWQGSACLRRGSFQVDSPANSDEENMTEDLDLVKIDDLNDGWKIDHDILALVIQACKSTNSIWDSNSFDQFADSSCLSVQVDQSFHCDEVDLGMLKWLIEMK